MEIRLQKQMPDAHIRHLSLAKEGRTSRGGLDDATVSAALIEIKKKIYERVGKAMGNTYGSAVKKISPNPTLAVNILKSSMRFIFVGNGFTVDPYENGLRYFHRAYGWDKEPQQVLLDAPADFVRSIGEKEASTLFKRFTVAYGLSFDPVNLVPAKFPNEVDFCAPLPADFLISRAGEETVDT